MNNLQQAASFGPFVWKLFSFFEVTCWARENEVRGIVSTTPTQWDNMLDMIKGFTLVKFLFAVVATPFLQIHHTRYILLRVGSSLFLLCSASMFICQMANLTAQRFAIASFNSTRSFWVCMLPNGHTEQVFLSCPNVVRNRVRWFAWLLSAFTVASLAFLSIALTTVRREFICTCGVVVKKLRSGQKVFVAFSAALFPINIPLTRFTSFSPTQLTARRQAIFLLVVLVEKLKRCGIALFARNTAFLRGTQGSIHDLNCLSFSVPCFCVARAARLPLVHMGHETMLGNISIISFFFRQTKTVIQPA